MIGRALQVVRQAVAIVRQQQEDQADIDERAAIAKAFNDRYTYRMPWVKDAERLKEGTAMFGLMPSSGYAWMCPECNQIHHPTACCSLVGLKYPRCCGRPDGDRLDDGIKTRA